MKVEVHGVQELQRVFDELGHELSPREMVQILRPAGREVVKAARNYVPLEGELKRATKRDIGIVKARVVKGQAEVNVGLKFGYYDINNQVQKVAPIVRHMTEGFQQSNRTGEKSGITQSSRRSRGKVRNRTQDFVEKGFNASQQAQMQAINQGVVKKVQKMRTKHGL